MNITLEKYIKILDEGYTLDILYLLKLIKDGADLSNVLTHPKIAAINQMLLRKQLITEDRVTLSGDQLLAYLDTDGIDVDRSNIRVVKRLTANDFDKWWMVYPSTNNFVYKNKNFKGTRTMRVKKDACKELFKKFLNEGMTAEDIIAATEYHFTQAKEESYKKGENKLTYIANSERYLRERMFEPFIEIYKQVSKQPEDYDGVNI